MMTDTVQAAAKAASDAASSVATKFMYGGGATSIGSWLACKVELTQDDWTVLFGGVGALVAIGGFIVNWHYRRAEHRLAVALAKKQGLTEV